MSDEDPFVAHLERHEGLRDVAEIGRGAMGIVYSATDEQLGRQVAVKRLTFDLLSTEESEVRFRKEMKNLAALRHEAVVRIFSGRVVDGVEPYYVMEFVQGINLREEIGRRRNAGNRYTVEDTCRILRPIASALDYIHGLSTPIIHRDVKPANILRPGPDNGGASILADFGISRVLGETTSGSFLGTTAYSAPEAFASLDNPDPALEPTEASDNYSLALIAFEMLTLQQLSRLMSEAQWRGSRPTPNIGAEALHAADSDAAEAVTAVFSRGLANLPVDRFGSAVEFVDALEAAGRGSRNSWVVPEQHIGAGGVIDATRPLPEQGRDGTDPDQTRFDHARVAVGAEDTGRGRPDVSRPAKSGRAWIAAGLGVIIIGAAGVLGYVNLVAWPADQKAIADAFSSAVPGNRLGTASWAIGGAPVSVSCDPVRWRDGEAIRCGPGDGREVQAVLTDFGTSENRSDQVTGMFAAGEDWESRTVRAEGSGCGVDVLMTTMADTDATLILPEGDRDNFLVMVSGDNAHEEWKTLPICT